MDCEVYATKEDRWGNVREQRCARQLLCWLWGGSVSVATDPDRLSKAKRIDRWGFG